MADSIQNPVRIKVTGATYWKGSGTKKERIYITTVPRTEIFYDLQKEEWVTHSPEADMEKAVEDLFRLYDTDSVSELLIKLKEEKKNSFK